MPRYKKVNGERVQLTDAEETARDAEEKVFSDGYSARKMTQIRRKRNLLLAETDWWASSDVSDSFTDARKKYRTDLRNLPSTISDPTATVTWPTKPD